MMLPVVSASSELIKKIFLTGRYFRRFRGLCIGGQHQIPMCPPILRKMLSQFQPVHGHEEFLTGRGQRGNSRRSTDASR